MYYISIVIDGLEYDDEIRSLPKGKKALTDIAEDRFSRSGLELYVLGEHEGVMEKKGNTIIYKGTVMVAYDAEDGDHDEDTERRAKMSVLIRPL